MLNKDGYTVLDMAIREGDIAKATMLIEKAITFTPQCSLKYVKRPNKLDLKFEKAFTLALHTNSFDLVKKFPARQIKTVHVLMS